MNLQEQIRDLQKKTQNLKQKQQEWMQEYLIADNSTKNSHQQNRQRVQRVQDDVNSWTTLNNQDQKRREKKQDSKIQKEKDKCSTPQYQDQDHYSLNSQQLRQEPQSIESDEFSDKAFDIIVKINKKASQISCASNFRFSRQIIEELKTLSAIIIKFFKHDDKAARYEVDRAYEFVAELVENTRKQSTKNCHKCNQKMRSKVALNIMLQFINAFKKFDAAYPLIMILIKAEKKILKIISPIGNQYKTPNLYEYFLDLLREVERSTRQMQYKGINMLEKCEKINE